MKTAAPAGTRNGGDCSKGFGGTFERKQYTNQRADSTASYLIAEQIAQKFDPFSVDLVLTFERSIAFKILSDTDDSIFDLLDDLITKMDALDGDPDFEPWLGSREDHLASQTSWACGNLDDLEHDDEAETCHETLSGGQGL